LQTVWQCCWRDAGRAGFRRAVVGAIFLSVKAVRRLFFDDKLAKLLDGEGQAKRALSGLP